MLKILDTPAVDDTDADALLDRLPEPDAATMLIVRNLQAQITALEARVLDLETP